MTKDDILSLLHGVAHPETGSDIVTMGIVENIVLTADKVQFTLNFPRARDPFALSLKKLCEQLIVDTYPHYEGKVTIYLKEAAPKKATPKADKKSDTEHIKNIIAVSSAKGGVGKSTVTANLAVSLARMGYNVGVLDADIYGPSQPMMFGVENYQPTGEKVGDVDMITPATALGVKIMSIGFFIKPDDALVWRGPMATSALKQMIHQTIWGSLDFLLIDLPPGTGDVHLALISELKISAAIIVSTPQKIALADVKRGISMFRGEHVNIPILGLVENMSWFTPEELPNNRYYIFGNSGAKDLADSEGLSLLAEIPLIQSVREAADSGSPISSTSEQIGSFYTLLAKNVVTKISEI